MNPMRHRQCEQGSEVKGHLCLVLVVVSLLHVGVPVDGHIGLGWGESSG